MVAPGFWDDMDKATRINQRSKAIQDRLHAFKVMQQQAEDIEVLIEMADEDGVEQELKSTLDALETQVEALHLTTLLKGSYDRNNAILSLHAGAGGTEAQDWTEMLYRMYTRWGEQNGYEVKPLDYLEGDDAGVKSVTFAINGENAYGYLKSEKGVHRLVRISPFDSSGRRHTSFASLDVMPELDDSIQVGIRTEDLKIDTYRSGGAGGQHVNKTESAVRITHLPSGIIVACQTERSQMQNKETCMRMLRSKLAAIAEQEQRDLASGIQGEQKRIEWGSQIRSYVFCPYTMVKDHRTNAETGNVQAVMDGDLNPFMHAYLAMEARGEDVSQITGSPVV